MFITKGVFEIAGADGEEVEPQGMVKSCYRQVAVPLILQRPSTPAPRHTTSTDSYNDIHKEVLR